MQWTKAKIIAKVLLVKHGRVTVAGDSIKTEAKNQTMIVIMITDVHIVLDGTMGFTTVEKDWEK